MTRARKAAAVAEAWFAQRGWKPFAFQRDVWAAMLDGRSGLLHATTGSGKTYAVWWRKTKQLQPAPQQVHYNIFS